MVGEILISLPKHTEFRMHGVQLFLVSTDQKQKLRQHLPLLAHNPSPKKLDLSANQFQRKEKMKIVWVDHVNPQNQ